MRFLGKWKKKRNDIVCDFVMYQIFAKIFDYDIEAYLKESKKRARELGGEHVKDLERVEWLKSELENDSDLINRIRKMIEEE